MSKNETTSKVSLLLSRRITLENELRARRAAEEHIHSKIYPPELPSPHAKMHPKSAPQKLNPVKPKAMPKSHTLGRSPKPRRAHPHSHAQQRSPALIKTNLSENSNIHFRENYWKPSKINAKFWQNIWNKGKVTLGSLQSLCYVSSYLHLKSFAWKRNWTMFLQNYKGHDVDQGHSRKLLHSYI